MMKEKKRSKSSAIAWTLARAIHDPECPAREVISNPWLYRDIINLAFDKPKIKFIMISGGMYDKTSEIYTISTNTWINGPNLPQTRHNHEMTFVNAVDSHHEIFLIGGEVDHHISKSVVSLTIPTTTSEMDSIVKKKWKVMPKMDVKRIGHGVGVVDGKIFVIGGWDGRIYFKAIEVFSVKEGKWIDPSDFCHVDSHIPPEMSTERVDMGVAVIEEKIFVIGGYNRTDGFLSKVEVLNTGTNKWSTLSSTKTPRSKMGIVVIDDRFIWILGGWNYNGRVGSIEIFDVEKNEWSTSSMNLIAAGYDIKAIAVDHKIFIIGDKCCGDFSNIVEVLDIDEMKWSEAAPMIRPRCCHSVISF